MGIALLAAACGSSGSKSNANSSATTAKPTGATTGGAPSGAAPAIAAGPGCTTPVKIGVTYSTDEGAVLTQLGNAALGKEVSSPTLVQTTEAVWNHIAAYVDATGGIAGCPVKFVYYNFQFGDPAGESDNSQNECTAFAEDQHVFAELNLSNENSTLISCLAKKKTVIIYGGGLQYRPTPADFQSYAPYLYNLAYVDSYRLGTVPTILAGSKFFGANPAAAKVGILVADDGSGTNQTLVSKYWVPALAQLGIKNPTVITYFQCHSVSDCANTTNDFSSAVLKFRQAGVDHVLFTPDGGDAVFFFFQVAHSQKYYPQYGMTTASGPSLFNTEPKDEQGSAMAVSWYVNDVFPNLPAALTAAPPNTTKTRCAAMLKQYYPAYYQLYYYYCDEVFFLQDALKGATKISADTLKMGADRLAGTFPMSSGYGNAYFGEPCHYDGATTARVIQWSTPKQSWSFVSGPVTLPQSTCPTS
jgi:ABC-type branched-subunit amino acid transport system substrate-binding protein